MATNVETISGEQGRRVLKVRGRAAVGGAPFPIDTTAALAALTRQFEQTREPIEVEFRKLVHWIKSGERASHYLHPYPAKLLPHIAHFFLATDQYAGRSETVLDPFAGSGTVALETVLSGRRALYAEANPLGRLLTAVKTRAINATSLDAAEKAVLAAFARSRARN
ncbi:MAG: hypothetical protein EON93_21975, partial [Burkholderiales bacterium]